MILRPVTSRCLARRRRDSGYTLVEILVASTLTLILMTAVVRVFSGVGTGITNSRRALEAFDRLRSTASLLRMDLQGVTVTMLPPRRPEDAEGYFELVESGPAGQWAPGWNPDDTTDATAKTNIESIQKYSSDPIAVVNGATGRWDSTVGQRGDILLFTTRNSARPFVGRYGADQTIQSDVAEVAWFLRGRTLHRRVLLIAPGIGTQAANANFFALNDVSVRKEDTALIPNTLSSLTKRECRFAHPIDSFPFDVRRWGLLGLPTLLECSSPTYMATTNWIAGSTPVPPSAAPLKGVSSPNIAAVEMWSDNPANDTINAANLLPDKYLISASLDGSRMADDVVLTNVIGFDVKVWDPGAPIYWKAVNGQNVIVKPGDRGYDPADYAAGTAIGYGAYVDLGYDYVFFDPTYVTPAGRPPRLFHHVGRIKSSLNATGTAPWIARVYDTGSSHYENEGIPTYNSTTKKLDWTDTNAGRATNGLDDLGQKELVAGTLDTLAVDGIVDSPDELLTSPPYPVPLRGIQVKIRVYEPDSRQIREVTIEQDFLPK